MAIIEDDLGNQEVINERILRESLRVEELEGEIVALFVDGAFTDINLATTKWAEMEKNADTVIPSFPAEDKDGNRIEITKPGRAPIITVDFRD